MKKLFVFVLALTFATAGFAANAVTYTLSDAGSGVLQIDYDATGSDDGIVGVSLVVTLSGDATIDPVTGVVAASSEFPVYIDAVHDVVTATGFDPETWDPCFPIATPLATTDAAGEMAAAGNAFAICMGRLDTTDAAASGTLVQLQLTGTGSTTVTVASDDLRGGTVGSVFDVAFSPAGTVAGTGEVTVNFGVAPCLVEGQVFDLSAFGETNLTVTATMIDKWNYLGNPDCWCCVSQKLGNGVYTALSAARVDVYDLAALKQAWFQLHTSATYNACADYNLSGRVDLYDLAILKRQWFQSVGTCP